MKLAANIAGALLGLAFIAFSMMFFLNYTPKMDPPPEGSYPALFMASFAPSGWLAFVKSFELLGGILVAIPKTRNLGLLVLGPIIINITAYHVFLTKGEGIFSPMPVIPILIVLSLFLLWTERKAFAGLINR